MTGFIVVAAIVGFILGIQTPIQFGFLLLALLVVATATGRTGEGLPGLIVPIVGTVLLLGMLAGDVYVHWFYPEQSELAPFFNGIPNPLVPPGAK